jgi:hypothetical protein
LVLSAADFVAGATVGRKSRLFLFLHAVEPRCGSNVLENELRYWGMNRRLF